MLLALSPGLTKLSVACSMETGNQAIYFMTTFWLAKMVPFWLVTSISSTSILYIIYHSQCTYALAQVYDRYNKHSEPHPFPQPMFMDLNHSCSYNKTGSNIWWLSGHH